MLLKEAIQQDAERRKTEETVAGIVPQRTTSIAILTPTLGSLSDWWHTSTTSLVWPTNIGRAPVMMRDMKGGEVGQMRNRMVKATLDMAEAQNVELDSIFWLDDDVIVSRFALVKLRAHDVDIAAGVYFTKLDIGADPLIFAGGGSGTKPFLPDEVFESWGYAQGLSCVKTDVFRRMVNELDLGVDEYGSPCWFKQPEFAVHANGNLSLGGTEDFHFFANAEKLGIRPLVDCTKHTFGFHYSLAKKVGYPLAQWAQFVKREPIIWPANRHHGEVIWE
jgi:hypothetical protein